MNTNVNTCLSKKINSCIIVIPVYKVECSTVEQASFRQCFSVLRNYDICLITFKELDLTFYSNEAKRLGKDFHVEYFDKSYFTSVEGYNLLCLNKDLYERFVHQYEYMFIYQLDAWVFRDELQDWCDKGYDYLGAPWFEDISDNEDNPIYTKRIEGVGNGGLTLRRIKYCLEVLSCNQYLPYIKPRLLWKMSWHKHRVIKGRNIVIAFFMVVMIITLKTFGFRNSFYWYLHNEKKRPNEDYIFSLWACHSYLMKSPHIPSALEAATFSFEVNPSYLYEKTGKLPFGCHAFEKWEYEEFWKKYIKI